MGVMKHVNQCCCGCTLKTGSIIIGTLSSANGLVTLIMILQSLYAPHPSDSDYFEFSNSNIHLTTVVAGIIAFCQLVLGIVLILGADRGRPQLVRSWLLFSYFKLGMDVMGTAYILYMLLVNSTPANVVIMVMVGAGIGLVLEMYCITVVYGFYKQLVVHGDILPLKEEV